MILLQPYQDSDFTLLNEYFSRKEIKRYTNKGGHRILALFAIYKSRFMILKDEEKILGCGVIRWKWSRDTKRFGWWLYAIWINPEHRGKGLGVILMQHLFDELRNKNIKHVCLTVDNDNQIAISLYTKLGMKAIRETDTYKVMRYEL